MFRPLFHAWERRLASVTKDRLVRPFDWGADWLSSNHDHDAAHLRVARWIDEVMRDTDAFFDTPPTSDFELTPSDRRAADKGEAGTLRFPSAFVSPHAQNNTVVARWFP